jgi:co-chaperonin GroES (HSP10)
VGLNTAPTALEGQDDPNDKDQGIRPIDVARQTETMGYRFMGPRIVIMRDPMDTKVGSIYLPQTGQREKRSGTIVAVGLGMSFDAKEDSQAQAVLDTVRPGQKVLFTKYEAVQMNLKLLEKSVTLDFLHWKDIYVLAPANRSDEPDWAEFNQFQYPND